MNDFVLNDQDVVSMTPNRNFAKTSTSKVIDIKGTFIDTRLGEYADWVKTELIAKFYQ